MNIKKLLAFAIIANLATATDKIEKKSEKPSIKPFVAGAVIGAGAGVGLTQYVSAETLKSFKASFNSSIATPVSNALTNAYLGCTKENAQRAIDYVKSVGSNIAAGTGTVLQKIQENSIATGTIAGISGLGAIYCYLREPNSEKIKRVNLLWNECQNFLANKIDDKSLFEKFQHLQTSPFIKNKKSILNSFNEISNRYAWYVNQSSNMKQALAKITHLKELVEEYEQKLLEARIASINNVWEEIAKTYNPLLPFYPNTINSNDKTIISTSSIVNFSLTILILHSPRIMYLKKLIPDYTDNPDDPHNHLQNTDLAAYNKISMLKKRLAEHQAVIDNINKYERLIKKYYYFLFNNNVLDTIKYMFSNSQFPLVQAVQDINQDIDKLKQMNITFTYIPKHNDLDLIEEFNPINFLQNIVKEIVISNDYTTEKTLKAEYDHSQKMLQLEAERVQAEKDKAKAEKQRAQAEYDRAQAEWQRAWAEQDKARAAHREAKTKEELVKIEKEKQRYGR